MNLGLFRVSFYSGELLYSHHWHWCMLPFRHWELFHILLCFVWFVRIRAYLKQVLPRCVILSRPFGTKLCRVPCRWFFYPPYLPFYSCFLSFFFIKFSNSSFFLIFFWRIKKEIHQICRGAPYPRLINCMHLKVTGSTGLIGCILWVSC